MSPFFNRQQVEGMWRNAKKDRRGDICLYFHQRTRNLMWGGKAEIGAEMSRFREEVRKGNLCSKTYNNFDREDCDGKIWYSLTIQATPKLKDTNGEPAQLGMSPINLLIFGYIVDGWTYYFKQRANREVRHFRVCDYIGGRGNLSLFQQQRMHLSFSGDGHLAAAAAGRPPER